MNPENKYKANWQQKATIAALLAWGVVTGLDFVSVLQAMVARPLVAATVAGVIAGDPTNGVLVGMALELYALEVLPVGGARSPDYGPGAVAAAAAVRGATPATLGLAVAVGLLVAYVGGFSIVALRRRNTVRVRAAATRLDAGDLRTISRIQVLGILGDAARALGLTALGLGVAYVARHWLVASYRASVLLTAVMVAGWPAHAARGAARRAQRGRQRRGRVAGDLGADRRGDRLRRPAVSSQRGRGRVQVAAAVQAGLGIGVEPGGGRRGPGRAIYRGRHSPLPPACPGPVRRPRPGHHDLGRAAGRHLRGACPIAPPRARARYDHRYDLCGRGIFHPRPGPDRQTAFRPLRPACLAYQPLFKEMSA